jgi:hypothetical protein
MKPIKPALVWVVAAAMAMVSLPRLALADTIATDEVARSEGLAVHDTAAARALLNDTLARADVVDALRAQGVDPAAAQARVDALSDAEALALAHQVETAPAGADGVLGTIVFLFVLLLVTDILGFTKIFPFTRSLR